MMYWKTKNREITPLHTIIEEINKPVPQRKYVLRNYLAELARFLNLYNKKEDIKFLPKRCQLYILLEYHTVDFGTPVAPYPTKWETYDDYPF